MSGINKNTLWLHQKHYVLNLIKKYGLQDANTTATPADISVKLKKEDGVSKTVDPTACQSIIGSLMYAATATRPDISFAVGVLSKFCSKPTTAHFTAAKRVLHYLKGTPDLALKYHKSVDGALTGYSDVDWAGDLDDRHCYGQLFRKLLKPSLNNGRLLDSFYKLHWPQPTLSEVFIDV